MLYPSTLINIFIKTWEFRFEFILPGLLGVLCQNVMLRGEVLPDSSDLLLWCHHFSTPQGFTPPRPQQLPPNYPQVQRCTNLCSSQSCLATVLWDRKFQISGYPQSALQRGPWPQVWTSFPGHLKFFALWRGTH